MTTTIFNVPSISCSACSNKIQQELKSVNGVHDVQIDMKTQTVRVEFDSAKIQPQDIRKTVSLMGYEVIR
ncbi:MAG: heavy-metal-associated domain-containing protein [Clostridia bacterium]|nr:heavy-metal-associated domain-containing protein [Clostridia bacterium]